MLTSLCYDYSCKLHWSSWKSWQWNLGMEWRIQVWHKDNLHMWAFWQLWEWHWLQVPRAHINLCLEQDLGTWPAGPLCSHIMSGQNTIIINDSTMSFLYSIFSTCRWSPSHPQRQGWFTSLRMKTASPSSQSSWSTTPDFLSPLSSLALSSALAMETSWWWLELIQL